MHFVHSHRVKNPKNKPTLCNLDKWGPFARVPSKSECAPNACFTETHTAKRNNTSASPTFRHHVNISNDNSPAIVGIHKEGRQIDENPLVRTVGIETLNATIKAYIYEYWSVRFIRLSWSSFRKDLMMSCPLPERNKTQYLILFCRQEGVLSPLTDEPTGKPFFLVSAAKHA